MTSNARKRKHETILTEQLEGLVQAQTIAASSITDIDQVISLIGIKYRYGVKDHYWKFLKENEEIEVKHACPRLDLILFDRVSLKEDATGARNLVLKEGRTMTVACISKAKEISGVADYVLGYPAQQDASTSSQRLSS
ncbi:hypothetical protein V8E54_010991 [Elaphomyces granulatus]